MFHILTEIQGNGYQKGLLWPEDMKKAKQNEKWEERWVRIFLKKFLFLWFVILSWFWALLFVGASSVVHEGEISARVTSPAASPPNAYKQNEPEQCLLLYGYLHSSGVLCVLYSF